ncbi:MAG: hypothetical protein NZ931_01595 [Aigarchaeota archaeon]|nr:hypothetical protein [Aigarchaeota archaeon]
MSLEEKIRAWLRPISVKIGDYKVRDVHAESLRPLLLDSQEFFNFVLKREGRRNEPVAEKTTTA